MQIRLTHFRSIRQRKSDFFIYDFKNPRLSDEFSNSYNAISNNQ
ncbi:hypothetical protein SX4_0647 [Vibrio mimicus SX-4]|nr:hypothetical protein SX4_0647 [Vibrio mimicus SX-4]